MIAVKINMDKVDKTKFYKGAKGTYLNVVLIETPGSEYGEFMCVQDSTKEEREAGTRGAILGNGKILGGKGSGSRPAPAERPKDDTNPPF